MVVKGSNQSLVKITNQHLIINAIRTRQTLSRSELAKILQLSNPSVSKHVDNLIDKGLLVETGAVITDIGRRPIMLEFNGHHGCVAVVDLSSNDSRICIADLLGNKLEYSRVDGGLTITTDMLQKVMDTLCEMLESLGGQCGPLLGICVGAPGVIEPETGRIHWSGRIDNYQEVDMKSMFTERFGVPVIVKSDINLAVVGESRFGGNSDAASVILVNIDAGVTQSLIIDGKLYEGRRGVACDIGVTLPMHGDILNAAGDCDSYLPFTLERMLSINRIVRDVRALFSDGRSTVMRDWITEPDELVFDDVVKAYGMGDPMVCGVIKLYAKQVALMVKNLASLFDVDRILLGGFIAKLGTSFLNEILDIFACLPGYSRVDIRLSKLFDTAVIFGGIDTSIEDVINRIICSED